jgi:hypothetical protein
MVPLLDLLVEQSRQSQSPVTFYQDAQVTLQYFPRVKCIRSEWRGFFDVGRTRQALELMYEFADRVGGVKKWLTDNTEEAHSSTEEQEWLSNNWFPRIFQAFGPDHKLAYVHDGSFIGQPLIGQAQDQQPLTLNAHDPAYFTSEAEALNWLEMAEA